MTGEPIAHWRRQIDEIDRQIVDLLVQRALAVEEIGRQKSLQSLPIYEPAREDQVYANVLEACRPPLPSDAARRIFERIIDEMRHLQQVRMRGEVRPASPSQ